MFLIHTSIFYCHGLDISFNHCLQYDNAYTFKCLDLRIIVQCQILNKNILVYVPFLVVRTQTRLFINCKVYIFTFLEILGDYLFVYILDLIESTVQK